MSKWDNYRIVCKHFNLDYLDIKYRVGLGDYYCMLADAIYAEEADDYNFALLTHGSDGVKKWPQPRLSDRVQRQTPVTYRDIIKVTDGSQSPQELSAQKMGRMEFFEKATGGRRILFKLPDGSHVDRHGSPIEELRESDLILPARMANG